LKRWIIFFRILITAFIVLYKGWVEAIAFENLDCYFRVWIVGLGTANQPFFLRSCAEI